MAVSGAGAEAKNIILPETKAFVENSTIDSAGDVAIDVEKMIARKEAVGMIQVHLYRVK